MLKLNVSGMTCDHCVSAVTKAVSALPNVAHVQVDLGSGRVVVDGSPDPQAVREAIVEEGYEVA